MADVQAQDWASSNAQSPSGHSTSLSSTGDSLNSPLPPSTSTSANSPSIPPIRKSVQRSKQSKHSRTIRHLSIDQGVPNDAINQLLPCSKFPTRSKSLDGISSQPVNILSHGQKPLHDEVLPSQQTTPSPFIDVSYDTCPSLTSSAPRRSIRHPRSKKCQQQRKSIDLGYNMMQASLRRLRRSPSLWTSDKSSYFQDVHDRRLHDLHAEPQLSDQQKFEALKRARKIAQIFGNEALIDAIHGNGCISCHSADRRGSLSTIASGDVPSSIGSTRRRSSFDSSLLVEVNQDASTSLNMLKIPSGMASDTDEKFLSFPPSSSFSVRRRRAAKLTHFFGVNCQQISQSVTQKLSPPASQQTYSGFNDNSNKAVEVDIKVVGRRFWGLWDDEPKNADVADVIGKLRGLRVG